MPKIAVNWNRCSGKGSCVKICPVNVYELQSIKEHPETLKAVPLRTEDCILCMKCIEVCKERAIAIEEVENDK